MWPGTLIIEQKSAGKDLYKADSQALDYFDWLPERDQPRYILTCDFQRWRLTDLESREVKTFTLAELPKHRDHLKWIAAYQVTPIKAVTHIAPIERFEPFGDEGKFKVVFAGPPVELAHPIPFGNAPSGAMQGVRYTTHEMLMNAKSVKDLV